MKSIKDKKLFVTMLDGSVWSVPVKLIAANHAAYYAGKDGIGIEKALKETWSIFEDSYEIEDWAEGNMNWEDVVAYATKEKDGEIDFQEGWVNGEKYLE